MNYKFYTTWSFDKDTKKLAKKYKSLKKDITQLIEELKATPQLGIELGGGLRKVRMRISDKHKGKSGGAHIITFTLIVAMDETRLHLVCIYDKSERENMTLDEIREVLIESGLAE